MHFRNSCQSCGTGKEGDENQVVSVHLEMFEIAFTYKGPNKVCNTPKPPWTTDHRNFGLSSYYKNICFKKLKILINCGQFLQCCFTGFTLGNFHLALMKRVKFCVPQSAQSPCGPFSLWPFSIAHKKKIGSIHLLS